MPDYSVDEIDKVSDDVSESDEVLIDGKPVKQKFKTDSDIENVINKVFLINFFLWSTIYFYIFKKFF